MKNTILLLLVLALGLVVEVVNADFTFGTPINLGPTVNRPAQDWCPSLPANGLELYFESGRVDGYGGWDLWVTTRETIQDEWGTPVNLGPTINSERLTHGVSISLDGLSLYFASNELGGSGDLDIWFTTRATFSDPWVKPVNLGPIVNSSVEDMRPSISADGLSLFFTSKRPGGYGGFADIWVTTRESVSDPWGAPVNLGPNVNSPLGEGLPSISADGRKLFFSDYGFGPFRPGGYGSHDLWVTTRQTKNDPWGTPVNLGPTVNSSATEAGPTISPDESTLYFSSDRPGGAGNLDIWQAPILPIVDFNGDGIVDATDICIMVDHWGENYPLCDIGPMPWGDGIVDVQDLIVLAEHLFEEIPSVEPEEVNVDEEDDGSQVELEQGQILVVTLESNPTTGYSWEVVETKESILQQMGEAEFKQSQTSGPPLVGAGGWEIFRFKAISAGQMTLQLVYHRPWEEGVEPLKTFSLKVVVR